MEDYGAWSVAYTETAVEKISEDTFLIVTGRENFHTYLRQVETNQWELANLDAGKYTVTECRELPKLPEVIAQAIAPKVTTSASKKLREVKAELATLKEEINNAKIAKTIISGLYSETDLQMTSSEKALIKKGLKPYLTVDVGSLSEQVAVTVRFDMSPSGKPVEDSILLIDSEGGSGHALKRAYNIARAAILRCGTRMGQNLPPEKYDRWASIQIRFDAPSLRE